MLRAIRPNTYKTHMARVNSEFYDFRGAEDEVAASLLATHITGLVHRARKKTLVKLIDHAHEQQREEFQKNMGGRQWWNKLVSNVAKNDGVSVFLPHDFVPRVVRDVIRMSEGETHGIRGCTLALEVRDGKNRVSLGKIVCDPKVPSTCTLHVRMARSAAPTQGLTSHSILSAASPEDDIYISPGYTLEKRRNSQKTA